MGMTPFDKSKISTLSLKSSILILPCLLGTIGFPGGTFSQNEGQGTTQQVTQ
jgi:hypothetical protein